MHEITEQDLFLSEQVELPASLRISTDAFCEGWKMAPTVNAWQLEEMIGAREWNFIKVAEGVLANGVGETSQVAIANALRLALLRKNARFNAVDVEYIEISQYPWFFLARMRVCQYLIQQCASRDASDEFSSLSFSSPKKRLPHQANDPYPSFNSSMPSIKQILTLRNSAPASQQ
jgi:hypothetical protein